MTASPPQLIPSSSALKRAILAVLFAAALGLRLSGITDLPTEFHPMRQFRAAIIARDIYYRAAPSAALGWEKSIAAADAAREELLEPRIVENLAAGMYLVAGGEYVWLPRLFSALCWLAGGYLLYRLTARMVSPDAGLAAAAFYLLNPFTVLASRVFQPDPLMMLLFMAGLNLIDWYDQQPSWKRLVLAALVSSAAPFVKPISIFGLFGAFAALSLHRHRGWRGLVNPQAAVFTAILALPTLIYYLAGVVAETGMHHEVSVDIIPSLLVERTFWGGWFTQISKAIGPLAFLAALIGFALIRQGRLRALILGLGAGYLVMGLIFTYTIATHDYYQLQLVPIVAICLTPLITPLMERMHSLFTRDLTRTVFVSLLLVILALFSAYENWWRTTFRYYYQNADPAVARYGPEIGRAVAHSTHVILLAEADGRPLIYTAQIVGAGWPYGPDTGVGPASGIVMPSAAETFAALQSSISAEYFIVTDFGELSRQPGLQEILSHYPVIAQTPAYLIYDLRHAAP